MSKSTVTQTLRRMVLVLIYQDQPLLYLPHWNQFDDIHAGASRWRTTAERHRSSLAQLSQQARQPNTMQLLPSNVPSLSLSLLLPLVPLLGAGGELTKAGHTGGSESAFPVRLCNLGLETSSREMESAHGGGVLQAPPTPNRKTNKKQKKQGERDSARNHEITRFRDTENSPTGQAQQRFEPGRLNATKAQFPRTI